MIYDKYRSRMQSIANIFGKIKRFRVLILSVVLAIVAIVSGLLAAKGAVSWEIAPKAEMTYGEGFSFEAKAFLSDVSYEFKAKDGDEWTKDTPTSAGEYSVRAVADAAFGNTRYSEEKTFSIKAVALVVSIEDDTLEYGEMPNLITDDLVSGDELSCSSFTYAGLNTEMESIESFSVCVVNKAGVDVTGCYTLTALPKQLDITARPITIDTPSAEKVYDGEALSAAEYTVSAEDGKGLYGADVITSALEVSIVDAGSVKNAMALTVENEEGVDVSAYYAPTYNEGTLTVKPRPIKIASQGNTWTYDGEAHTHGFHFTVDLETEESGLVRDHAIRPAFTGTITNVGSAENTFTVAISDGVNDVTGNYDISYEYGALVVEKRPITVTSESYGEWTYTAEYRTHEEYEITSGSLADGQTANVAFTGKIKHFGSAENTFTVAIFDGGEDVTDNYEITPVYGTLTMGKAAIVVRTYDDEKAYDGTALYNTAYTLIGGELFGGETLAFTDRTELVFVGATENVLSEYVVTSGGSENDGAFALKDNYHLTVEYGTLTVKKRAVTITAASDEKTYDGTPITNGAYTTENLPDGHTLTATVTTSAPTKHVGTYVNVASAASVFSTAHNKDVSDQFDLSYVNGALIIRKREVRLTLSGVEKTYDGTAQEVLEGDWTPVWDTAYAQPVDEAVYSLESDALTNANESGTYTVSVTFADGNNGDNYEVIEAPATAAFLIKPRPILVTTHTHEWTYDGQEHGCAVNGCTYGATAAEGYYDLVNGHTLTIRSATSLVNVGTENNILSLRVEDGNGGNNYTITYQNGTLTVKARSILVTAHTHTDWIYDGEAQSCLAKDCAYETTAAEGYYDLVNGHTLTLLSATPLVNVGTVENEVELRVEDGNEGKNYAISYEKGSITVLPRTIKVVAHTHTDWIYDGTEQSCLEKGCAYTVTVGNGYYELVSGHTIELSTASGRTNAGTQDNVVTVQVNDGNGGKNYAVEYENGELTISPRKVYLQLGDISKVYNGEAQSVTKEDIPENSKWIEEGAYLLPVDEAIYTVNCAYLTNVGTVDLTVSVTFDDGNNGDNYEVYPTSLTAKFSVVARPILVTTHTHEWIYDGEEHGCAVNGCTYGTTTAEGYYDLLSGHTLTIDQAMAITNVSESGTNLVTLTVNDGNDGKNYDISYAYGTLTIKRREVVVHTHDHAFMYNGEMQSCTDCGEDAYELEAATENTGLVAGHTMELTLGNYVVNVGDEEMNCGWAYFYDSEMNVIDNYTFSASCEWGTLTVTPRPIKVRTHTHEWTYNGVPQHCANCNYGADDLIADEAFYPLALDSHILVITKVTPITNVADSGAQNVVEFVVEDGNGGKNYDISYAYGTLTINKRAVYLEIDEITKVYNGAAQTVTEADLQGGYHWNTENGYEAIVDGHVLRFVTIDCGEGLKDVGSTEFTVTVMIASDNDDVTENYDVYPQPIVGTFSVIKKDVTFSVEDISRVYNGANQAPTTEDLHISADGLIDGHTFGYATGWTPQRNVGEYEFEITVAIFEGENINDANVTGNYNILPDPLMGKFIITKRPIVVASHDHEWIYDGEAHSCTGEDNAYTLAEATEDTGLVGGHTLEVLFTGFVTNVGEEVANTFDIAVFSGAVDLTDNYMLSTDSTCGTLTVAPRKIKIVSTHSHTFTYDGQEHSCKTESCAYTVTVEEENGYYDLVNGHTLTIVTATTITNVAESGKENAVTFRVEDGNAGKNYTIDTEATTEKGTLSIAKKEVVVSGTCSHEWFYDGQEHGCTLDRNMTHSIECSGLGYGHELVVLEGTTIKEVGEKENVLTFGVSAANGDDVSANYTIKTEGEYGTLRINACEIEIKAQDVELTYTGAYPFASYVGAYDLISGELPTGYTLETTGEVAEEIVNAGASTEHTIRKVAVKYNGVPVTENFTIKHTTTGTFTIDYRPIEIVAKGGEKVYDGTPLVVASGEYDIAVGSLADGHTLTVKTTGAERTEVGVTINEITVDSAAIVDENGESVLLNYAVTYTDGEVKITRALITIRTGSGEKEYDGTPLTCGEYEVDGLTEGYEVQIEIFGSQTDAGTSFNNFEFTILSGDGEDVTAYYTVNQEPGELTVTQRTLSFRTGSAQKVYDGTPLTSAVCDLLSGELVEGHRIVCATTGTQMEVGESANGMIFTVYDENDNDVSYNYKAEVEYGKLIVLAEEENSVLFYVTSNTDGNIYLRRISYGDYSSVTGVWGAASEYTDSSVSPLYYAGLAAEAYGVSASTVTIEAAEGMSGSLPYMLPYYVAGSSASGNGDVYAEYAWTDAYTLEYYAYQGRSATVPSEYAAAEAAYKAYVYENYLDLPTSTKAYMRSVIEAQGWSLDDENVIDRIALYVRNAAVYDLDYDRSLDTAGDVAVAFLRDYKVGVCRHYASAATAIFRALGIPARYTEGYYSEVVSGEKMEVTTMQGHAWVEVYIDGMGWVNVEVTGSGQYKQELRIKPEDFVGAYPAVQSYDASTRAPYEGIEDVEGDTLSRLVKNGYSYEAVVTGSLNGPGSAVIEIVSFVLYDRRYNIVTDDFEVVRETGTITISEKIVTLIGEAWKYYDGTALTYNTSGWLSTIMVDGVTYQNGELLTVTFDVAELPVLVDAGKLSREQLLPYIHVYDSDGNDVTEEYYIDTTGLVFEVKKQELTIKIADAEKPYDGTPLTSNEYTLQNGRLIDGHTMVITTNGSITEVGSTTNGLQGFVVTDRSGNDVSQNYAITYADGTLTVTE